MATLTRLAVNYPPLGNDLSWGSQLTAWTVQSKSATRVLIENSDFTFTQIVGSGFTFDAANNALTGTVTQVIHLAADGTTQIEKITNLPAGYQLTAFQANLASDIGGLLAGDDTIAGSNPYADVLFGYAGNDTFNPGLAAGSHATSMDVSFDLMVGGAGSDTFNAGASFALNYIVAYSLETGSGGVTVDLAANTAIDTFGNTDHFNNIRNIMATDLADSLLGGAGDDMFAPGGGTDTIDGAGGFNILSYAYLSTLQADGFGYINGITVTYASATGGTVTDPTGATDTFSNIQRVYGTNFNDVYNGHAGTAEVFAGMGGNDVYNGNSDGDMVDCSAEYLAGGVGGISVNLGTVNAQNGVPVSTLLDSLGGSDQLSGISGVIGTNSDDNFYGNNGNNTFIGNAGTDRFRGNGGNDTFNGGDGRDIAEYRFESGSTPTSGITVNLTSVGNGTVTDTFGNTDTLISIEQIHGSNRNDVYVGSRGEDRFAPGQGDDQITSNGGRDVILYVFDTAATSGIHFDGSLSSNQLTSAYYGTDTFIGFNNGINLIATFLDDWILGTSAADILQPSNGVDTIDGGNGRDILAYTDSPSTGVGTTSGVTFNAATATSGTVLDSGGNTDTYTSIEVLRGSQFGDTFNGSTGNDIFQGLSGDDTFHGGGGLDIVDYSAEQTLATFFGQAAHGIVVDLASGTGTDVTGGTDTYDAINAIIGSNFADDITGSSLANKLSGKLGMDTLTGGGGNDAFIFDTALGPNNIDTITDFSNAAGNNDVMRLALATFTAAGPVGALDVNAFVAGAAAADASDRIIYDSSTGALYYDADGNGSTFAQIQFATLGTTVHPTNITAADFILY